MGDGVCLSLNVMVLVFECVGVLFEIPCIVLQRMCVLCL